MNKIGIMQGRLTAPDDSRIQFFPVNRWKEEFGQRLTNFIPMGCISNMDEWQGSVVFLVSDASTNITGINLVIDGGRSVW